MKRREENNKRSVKNFKIMKRKGINMSRGQAKRSSYVNVCW